MSFAFIFWDPPREVFLLPYLHFPILWYSLLFALGFLGGYFLFIFLFQKYLLNRPFFEENQVRSFPQLISLLSHPTTPIQQMISRSFFAHLGSCSQEGLAQKKHEVLSAFNTLFEDDFCKNFVSKDLSLQKILLSSCYRNPLHAAMRLWLEQIFAPAFYSVKQISFAVTEKLFVYMIIATIIGARLGHLLFYEQFSYYLQHPFEIFKIWEGGLASHGAAIAILIALFFFCKKMHRIIDWKSLLDLIAMPTAFAAVCIRIGNFFNQEILGKPSSLPWAIIFGHPMDGSPSQPRHPAQLYEAFFYLFVCFILFYMSRRFRFLLRKGTLMGFFLIAIFTFRFFIEFLKEEQSILVSSYSFLEMGQYLSLPFIILGLFLFFFKRFKTEV